MNRELHDIRKTNDRAARKHKRLAQYRQRTTQRRDKRRLLALLETGIAKGWVA